MTTSDMSNLTECKDCGHTVSKKAKTCPSCGVGNPAGNPSTLTHVLLFGFILWIGSHVLTESYEMQNGFASSDKSEVSSTRREMNASTIARREVTKLLKAPSTVEFSGHADTRIGLLRDRGPDVWIVKGYVDAQNSFGAMIRNKYQVVIVFEEGTNDNYKVESAELYE